jgi:hypothetical protein
MASSGIFLRSVRRFLVSSGMLRLVDIVRTDVSEELSAAKKYQLGISSQCASVASYS